MYVVIPVWSTKYEAMFTLFRYSYHIQDSTGICFWWGFPTTMDGKSWHANPDHDDEYDDDDDMIFMTMI